MLICISELERGIPGFEMPICIFTDSQNDPNANPWLIFGNGLL
jgi:hypothetical protein